MKLWKGLFPKRDERGGRARASKPVADGGSQQSDFWRDAESEQIKIEAFGYRVRTELRKFENTVLYMATNDAKETATIKKVELPLSQFAAFQSGNSLAERIASEMATLAKMSSGEGKRFVITYYDYKLDNTNDNNYCLYIRMDYLTSLAKLYAEASLTVRDALEMGVDICEALDWCHKNGRVHNNLNLNNIFINDEGRYVLGDFATIVNRQNEVEYCIAPEVHYNGDITVSSDIYSLGMVLFALLNKGLPPFVEVDSPEDMEIAVKRLRDGEIPSLSRSVNRRLNALVRKAISPIEQRFGTVDEMKAELEFLLSRMPDEWLDQRLDDMKQCGGDPEELLSDPFFKAEPTKRELRKKKRLEKKAKKKEVGEIKKAEKKLRASKRSKKLEPEEAELKRKNAKDYWFIVILITIILAVVAIGILLLYNFSNRGIYSLIESESYSVAYKEIEELAEKGSNVDKVLKAYIDACMADGEYKRVTQALPLFSYEAFEDTEYFISLYSEFRYSGKEKLAEAVYDYLYKFESLRPELDKLAEQ